LPLSRRRGNWRAHRQQRWSRISPRLAARSPSPTINLYSCSQQDNRSRQVGGNVSVHSARPVTSTSININTSTSSTNTCTSTSTRTSTSLCCMRPSNLHANSYSTTGISGQCCRSPSTSTSTGININTSTELREGLSASGLETVLFVVETVLCKSSQPKGVNGGGGGGGAPPFGTVFL